MKNFKSRNDFLEKKGPGPKFSEHTNNSFEIKVYGQNQPVDNVLKLCPNQLSGDLQKSGVCKKQNGTDCFCWRLHDFDGNIERLQNVTHLVDKLLAKLRNPLDPPSSEEGLPHLRELLPDQQVDLLCNAVVLPSESESESESGNDGHKQKTF